jgi:BirA family biotin operon repressor/biotin-[acetyl-CoA-carboxylase] ligase
MDPAQVESLAERLLKRIRQKPRFFISLTALARSLKVKPPDIETAARVLASWGYRIRIRSERVVFLGAPDSLIDTEIKHKLKTKYIGQYVHAYSSVKSTNDIADELAESGAPEGTLVTAEQQTGGRGRLGRSWHSEPGNGIYLSLILRPKLNSAKAPALSIVAAVALADAISTYLPRRVRIKWPNDVLIGRKRLRKTAGILTELSGEQKKINHVIIGVGINVNHGLDDFPDDIKPLATSLRRALRRKVRRVELLQKFLANLEKEYTAYLKRGLKKSHSKIRRYSSLIGHTIKLASGKHITEGKVVDIDADGCLVLEVDGTLQTVIAGEVTVVKD